MTELIVMCGLSGSGKSAWAEDQAILWGHKIVSSDDIRAELGDVNDQSQNDKVFQIFYQRIRELLKNGKDVIADATFLTIRERRRILNEVKNIDCHKTCVLRATPFKKCLEYNQSRKRQVPESVIYKQRARFQIPFYEEGWDDFIIARSFYPMNDMDYFAKIMIGFDQKNPHHKDSLLVHSIKVAESFYQKGYSFSHALLHDYGKLFTQSFDNEGIAHYYNHENVGTYELLNSYGITHENIRDMLFLVNYHMLPFGWKNEKAKEKWHGIFGENKFQMLMDFHQCDKCGE